MKRYVAVERMPWGKNHVEAGEELVNPSPESEPRLLELLLQSGRVKEAEPVKTRAEENVYKRRDLTAETSPERRPRGRRVGAMTTDDEPGITKPE